MILRDATLTDAGRVGAIMEGFARETPWLPDLWTGAEHIAHADAMIGRGWVRLAEDAEGILGFLARDRQEIAALYVDPARTGSGVGSALVAEAQRAERRLALWVHDANAGARAFYRRHGFAETAETARDQSDEGLPARRCTWRRDPEETT